MSSVVYFWGDQVLFGDSDGAYTDQIAFSDNCCCVERFTGCQACKDGNHPPELTVTLAGIVQGACDNVEHCPLWNDSWVVDYVSCAHSGIEHKGSWSVYYNDVMDPPCHYEDPADMQISLYIYWNYNQESGRRRIEVDVVSSGHHSHWVKDESSQVAPYDCEAFSDFDIPFSSEGIYCDGTSSTCKLAA